MKRVFAILQEPASYTVDRNHAVYDKLGVDYCYIDSKSEALSNESTNNCLSNLNDADLDTKLSDILSNYDIVIMNGYTGRIFRHLYKLNKRYKRIIGIDSDTQLRIPTNPIKRFAKRIYLRNIFRNKHYYGLAGGTGSHMDLFRHYGMAEERICLMPMVVNNEKFTRKNLTENTKRFRFLYVGRIIDVKNISVMLNAFVKGFAESDNVELRIVGKGELLENFKEQYKEFANIIFAGSKYGDDLVEEYHKASTLILPSSYEPWGLVVNEAIAAGLPVIVSDQVGAAHDLVKSHETGFIFPYQDIEALLTYMRVLIDDKMLYEKYAGNATSLMRDYWNYDLYEKCLKEFIYKAFKINDP